MRSQLVLYILRLTVSLFLLYYENLILQSKNEVDLVQIHSRISNNIHTHITSFDVGNLNQRIAKNYSKFFLQERATFLLVRSVRALSNMLEMHTCLHHFSFSRLLFIFRCNNGDGYGFCFCRLQFIIQIVMLHIQTMCGVSLSTAYLQSTPKYLLKRIK